jgi:hypothetical protein
MRSNDKYRKYTADPVSVLRSLLRLVDEDDDSEGAADHEHEDADDRRQDYGPSTRAEARWAHAVHLDMKARIAELRRRSTPLIAPIRPLTPIPPDVSALSRAEMLTRVTALVAAGAAQYAYRHLTALSDDDLRRLLAELVPTAKG